MVIRVHLNESKWHGDNAEAEIGDRQVGDKHIPGNLLIASACNSQFVVLEYLRSNVFIRGKSRPFE